MKEDAKPYRQKLRNINPTLAPLVKKELEKMLAAGIIAPTRHTSWVSNPVIVRKKNGEIRICVDFRNLNMASLKDNYPLPNMDTLLQNVIRAGMLSMLDGFSGYNQVMVHLDDRSKTTFTTPWGTFQYLRMPFGLLNAGSTFQRAMDFAFRDLIGKIIEIYQDDLTVFSKERSDHVKHLRSIFERCRKYGISLNPKKSVFGVDRGKLLGHIVSKEGIKIDPERIEAINRIPPPRNVKELKSFFGKINFVRRFVPNFAEIVNPMNKLLKKNVTFNWTEECKLSFKNIKKAITASPVLVSPDYSRDLIIYSFASEETITRILTQKDKEGHEHPIAFMSKNLRDAELNYKTTEKQAYALVKSLKHFRTYVGYAKITAYVPYPAIKDVLTQHDGLGSRAKWISKIQEYDIEIKPTKIVRGQGLAKLLTQTYPCEENLDVNLAQEALVINNEHEWYKDIVNLLKNLSCPPHLIEHQRRALRLKASRYILTEDGLGWRNPDGVILRCVNPEESKKLISELHDGFCGGHYAPKTTASKIMRAGYYWPTIYKDVYKYVRTCNICQTFARRPKLPALPLQPVIVEAPFQQWGLDFIGKFKENSSNGFKWILTCTDYFTRWVEAVPLKVATSRAVIKFLEEKILTRFGCPVKITTDNAKAFD